MKLDLGQLDEDLMPADRPLGVDKILAELEDDDLQALLAALHADKEVIPAARLSKALNNQGVEASAKTIVKWRERNDAQ